MTTLTNLKASNDPLAALLAMSDEQLDDAAGLAPGWKLEGGCYYDGGEPLYVHRSEYDLRVHDSSMYWAPSRDLKQAYELEQHCRERCKLYVRRIWGSGKFMYILTPLTEPGETYDKDRAGVWESDAGSHARAVTILAILGLLRKDGAA